MEMEELSIPGASLIRPTRFEDHRGFFSEVYNRRALAEAGLDVEFVQDNHSLSRQRGTIRGLHFQVPPHAVDKLVRVLSGAIFDVVVDLRRGSPTYGKHVSLILSESSWEQLFVPSGCAHGFCSLEPDTQVFYKVSDYWYPDVDRGLAWNDPDLGIDWPIGEANVVVSEKDAGQPRLSELSNYFSYEG